MFFKFNRTRLVFVLSLAFPVSVVAQQSQAGHRASGTAAVSAAAASQPGNPAARPDSYRSVFEGYRGHTDETPVSWREANDAVGRIGGWRAYAREAQLQPGQETGGSPRGGPSDTSDGHGAHKQR